MSSPYLDGRSTIQSGNRQDQVVFTLFALKTMTTEDQLEHKPVAAENTTMDVEMDAPTAETTM